MPTTPTGRTTKELALWMLGRMADSDEFLGVLRKARAAGKRDILDTPDYIARHKARLAKLHKADSEEDADITTAAAAAIDAIIERDLLSSREEFIDKAIAAYVEKYGADGLGDADRSLVEAARDEIEGHTQGAFEAGFVDRLADAAREEMARLNERGNAQERGGREN